MREELLGGVVVGVVLRWAIGRFRWRLGRRREALWCGQRVLMGVLGLSKSPFDFSERSSARWNGGTWGDRR